MRSEYSIYRIFGNIFIPDTYNKPFALLDKDKTDNILIGHYEDFKKKLMEVVK